ncbi:MAG: hypothetical protein NT075_30765, partial [Chloroflexi bacterium]|nr:hypothetical protein [Chloroflexota bacterium]
MSTVNIEAKQLCRYPISGKDWAKGGYHAELVLTDEMGNVNSQGMDFSKEGTLPQILLPKEGEMIGGVQAIKGVVMDPDLTNGRPLSRFRFLLKKGTWTLRTASDLTGFEANDAISVPQRYRKSTGL